MFKCEIENRQGNSVSLSGNEKDYQIIRIDGLNPPNAIINTTVIAGLDGARFNSARLETRELVIYLRLNGDVEENRINLYQFFPTKEWCRFWYENDHRSVYIECYVTKVEVSPFSEGEIMQITLLCTDPYFNDVQDVINDISKLIGAFKFPFSINQSAPIPFSTFSANRVTVIRNDSETETGVIIKIDVLDDIGKIMLRNTVTGESMTITDSFEAGDRITINTNRGRKSVTLDRDGTTSNLFSKLSAGFSFFQLVMGDNRFSYLIDDGANDHLVSVKFRHRKLYRGV